MTAGHWRLGLQYQSCLLIRLGYVDEKTQCPSAVAPCGNVKQGICSVIGQRDAGVHPQQLHDSANIAHYPTIFILPHFKHPFLLSYSSFTQLHHVSSCCTGRIIIFQRQLGASPLTLQFLGWAYFLRVHSCVAVLRKVHYLIGLFLLIIFVSWLAIRFLLVSSLLSSSLNTRFNKKRGEREKERHEKQGKALTDIPSRRPPQRGNPSLHLDVPPVIN